MRVKCRGLDWCKKSDREKELEYALLLMVYQYCTDSKEEYMDHAFMAAGETAFSALGLENGESAENVWKRIERIEDEMHGR